MDYSYFTAGPQPYQFFGVPQGADSTSNGHAQQHMPQVEEFPSQLTTVRVEYCRSPRF